MQKKLLALMAGLLAFATGLSSAVDNADARIRCNGRNQIIEGQGKLPTPYCEAEYLAAVAHGYRMRVTGSQIRHNINLMKRVCQFVGHDTRVADICSTLRNERRNRRWPG